MLWQPERHEALQVMPWDAGRARHAIERIARLTEEAFSPASLWPAHPREPNADGQPHRTLYRGACGTIWALHHLQARGAVRLVNDYAPHVLPLLEPNRAAYGEIAQPEFGSYLMGDTSIRMLHHALAPDSGTAEIAALVEGNMHEPSCEFMWGAPGTLLAAWFMHERTGESRFAELFRTTARTLESQLLDSAEFGCQYWRQDMWGGRDYIDAVHGFVGTAAPLVLGRSLLEEAEWRRWRDCIANTVRRTARHEGDLVNWPATLSTAHTRPLLMQYCHGSPGFVICLGDFPDDSLDDLLLGAAEAVWQAGPLDKGPQLCHGTGGNGYAFLKLWRRTQDEMWLDRARAFAMHAIGQWERELQAHGQPWHSLWTGHPGFAIYLLDCIAGTDRFPTVDAFFTNGCA